MTINDKILQIAAGYLGKDEEPGNSGWYDEGFETKMFARGWHPSEAWCAYFAELVWYEAYEGYTHIQRDVNRLFSGSAVQTLRNFQEEGLDWVVSRNFVPGCIIAFQRYKDGAAHWSGHLAIGVEAVNDVVSSIDGNSNPTGGREGYTVARVKRVINFKPVHNGLVMIGFIHPQQIILT